MFAIQIDAPKKRKWRSLLRKKWKTIRGYIRHPRAIDCTSCGFLGFGASEVTHADRILLISKMGGRFDKLCCFRSLWVDLELNNGGSDEEIWNEMQEDRRTCEGYLKYKPGWSAEEHRDLLLKRQDRRERFLMLFASAILGGIATLFFQWLTHHIFK